jgi:hypothetical protein
MPQRSCPFHVSSLCLLYLSELLFYCSSAPCALGQISVPKGQSVEVTTGVTVLLPAPWFLAERTQNAVEILYPLTGESSRLKPKPGAKPTLAEDLITMAARMTIEVQPYPSHSSTVKRLGRIASETEERSPLRIIAGWPAIERRRTAPLPNPGEAEGPPTGSIGVYITTAIAADTLIIRFETVLAPGTDPSLANTALEIARSIRVKQGNAETAQRELKSVSRFVSLPPKLPEAPAPHEVPTPENKLIPRPAPSPSPTNAGVASSVQPGFGELEVAVSENGQHVVVGANSGYSFSDDGGQTFTVGGSGVPCVYNGGCRGDPSLAVGKSGAVYFSFIGTPNNEPGNFPPPNGWTDTVSVSVDSGHTFAFAGNAVVCPSTDNNTCTVPDQPHVAADRFSSSLNNLDRVYLVWRNFIGGFTTARIVCSLDGALTWQAQTTIDSSGDFPRVTVGSDGSVYVAYVSSSSIMLRKFSTCDRGLTPQPPVTVASYVGPQACGNSPGPAPLPGLDRCNDGNTLNSPTVAVDDTNPNHVYVAWATSTSVTNENILVADSMDGGATFPRSVNVNSAVIARRFMPWACSTGGIAFVSWYDRRAASSANDDLTDYFLGSVSVVNGSLQPSPEANLSTNPDPECATGWPCGTWETRDATSCSVQPQLAGRCSTSWPGTGALCSFTNPQCPQGQQCNSWGGGCPKYGDYNGNACVAGRVYTAWSSATAPPGLPAPNGISIFSSVFVLPNVQVSSLSQNGKNWCATITATEAGQPVSGSVTVNGVGGLTNQQICFPACSKTVTEIVCVAGRKPPCFPITITEPTACSGTVSIPPLVSPIQISVGPL